MLAVLAIAVSAPFTAEAQQWSPEQREVIDLVAVCWDSWGTEDWAAYEQACPSDPEQRYWWMDESVPDYGVNEWRRWAEAFFPRIVASIHYEHRPIGVQIFGDVALYQFWATWSQEDANGQVQTQAQHRLDVLQRRNGQWTLIGGAGTLAPGQ